MSRLLMRMVMRLYLTMFLSVLAAVLVIFLVADFADRLGAYLNHPLVEVATLYWHKAMVALHQLTPAALLLAAGATASTVRKRGEWIAMQALGLSRVVLVAPIAAVALAAAVGMMAFDEFVVTTSGPRVDTMMVSTFHRYGDFRFFYTPQQWFRFGRSLVFVHGEPGDELTGVTIFEVDEGFRVTRRLEADSLRFVGESEWQARGVLERTFLESGEAPLRRLDELQVRLQDSRRESFLLRAGRPEYTPTPELLRQMDLRSRVGLPRDRQVLALHNRFAYPATGFAAAMFALALALRRSRRGHLTLALVEGLVVTMALFTMLLTARAAVLGEHLTAGVAAWAPIVGLLLGSVALWAWAEWPRSRAR